MTVIELAARFLALGPDHQAILDRLITKAEGGARKYGVLKLDGDGRIFSRELVDELLDAVHYANADAELLERQLAERDAVIAGLEAQLAGVRLLVNEQAREIERMRVLLSLAELASAPAQTRGEP